MVDLDEQTKANVLKQVLNSSSSITSAAVDAGVNRRDALPLNHPDSEACHSCHAAAVWQCIVSVYMVCCEVLWSDLHLVHAQGFKFSALLSAAWKLNTDCSMMMGR